MYDFYNQPNSAVDYMIKEERRKREKQEEVLRNEEIEKQNAPILEQLKRIEEQGNEQIKVLREDSERQKEQIKRLNKSEEDARQEARNAKFISIVSFCVGTLIAIASLIGAFAMAFLYVCIFL